MVKNKTVNCLGFTKAQLKHFADTETALDFVFEQLSPGSDHNKTMNKTDIINIVGKSSKGELKAICDIISAMLPYIRT
jgi:hypothetical protein